MERRHGERSSWSGWDERSGACRSALYAPPTGATAPAETGRAGRDPGSQGGAAASPAPTFPEGGRVGNELPNRATPWPHRSKLIGARASGAGGRRRWGEGCGYRGCGGRIDEQPLLCLASADSVRRRRSFRSLPPTHQGMLPEGVVWEGVVGGRGWEGVVGRAWLEGEEGVRRVAKVHGFNQLRYSFATAKSLVHEGKAPVCSDVAM